MGCNTSKETGAASSERSTGPAVLQAKGQASVKETKSNEETTMVSGEMPMYYYYAESLPMPWGIMYHSAASGQVLLKLNTFKKDSPENIIMLILSSHAAPPNPLPSLSNN